MRKVDSRRATLTISSLQPTDTANYTCTCTNTGGKNALNSTITVHCEYTTSSVEEEEEEEAAAAAAAAAGGGGIVHQLSS